MNAEEILADLLVALNRKWGPEEPSRRRSNALSPRIEAAISRGEEYFAGKGLDVDRGENYLEEGNSKD